MVYQDTIDGFIYWYMIHSVLIVFSDNLHFELKYILKIIKIQIYIKGKKKGNKIAKYMLILFNISTFKLKWSSGYKKYKYR